MVATPWPRCTMLAMLHARLTDAFHENETVETVEIVEDLSETAIWWHPIHASRYGNPSLGGGGEMLADAVSA